MKMQKDSVLVIGAGMGGLAAAIRLAAAGRAVTLCEAHGWAGGKMRVVPSAAGPVDAGPTVLTMRDVLAELFEVAGTELAAHVSLEPLSVLARHFWTDGTQLDLFATPEANAEAIGAVFGARACAEFQRFEAETRALFDAFDTPIMRSPRPDALGAARAMLPRAALWPWLAPGRTLEAMLAARFSEPRLRQLFGRYATYVGGNPTLAPAVLGLIWQAEARGVWAVRGGMAALAGALADLFASLGGDLRLNTPVARIMTAGGAISGAQLDDGEVIDARQIVFNGDPAALPWLLDQRPPRLATAPRSLSAQVWTFSAEVQAHGMGRDALAYHSVFFADDPAQEFGPLGQGRAPHEPTIYVCAQDRISARLGGAERFQFILNAPPVTRKEPPCPTDPLSRLARFGLHLSPAPRQEALTRPQDFAQLFPHSQGALYGLSPNGMLATFQRPRARTKLTGLYLAGGGVHPGAGVPMALLSGKHAATALLGDRISAARSRRMAMPGGMSTGSAMTARAPSR